MRVLTLVLSFMFLVACTTQGKLEYVTDKGERKTACETEYSGSPEVDKYAVEYILSYCASKVQKQGHTVIDEYLLGLDLTIPKTSNGGEWSFDEATQLFNSGQLSAKEYGYIIAYVDLGLNKPQH